jgi:glyoxylase-like metal-dependent hydrolase (beta-lactamase superfamily II)
MKTPDVIIRGKDNGDGMIIHYRTSRGVDIFGLAMPNIHVSTDWDLGPTWCYLVLGKKTTLIDTGRFGNLESLKTCLKSIDKELQDIHRIIITHSHEDHDGNLAEILATTQAELWAHPIYRQMISYHPRIRDGAKHPELPGSCRMCAMPKKVYENCLPYHKKRSSLSIDFVVKDDQILPDDDLSFVFTPGHSPDSICIILEDEVIFTGDTILPAITPHPSLAYTFEVNRRILPEEYQQENGVYGLMTYIKSLNKLAYLASQPLLVTLPAHRLFYNGQFNIIHSSSERAKEIIQFHIDRCRDILNIMDNKPVGIEDIAIQYFPPSQLAGTGKSLAQDEIMSHIEFLEECGDIRWANENKDLAKHTGSNNFLSIMGLYINQKR